jgi:ABC-type lipoprotein export system ATPase subunit
VLLGKSTLLNILSASTRPAGIVKVVGWRPVVHVGLPAVRYRRTVGFIWSNPQLLPYLSAVDNVARPCGSPVTAAVPPPGPRNCSTSSASGLPAGGRPR